MLRQVSENSSHSGSQNNENFSASSLMLPALT
jgi:hypothetical protein